MFIDQYRADPTDPIQRAAWLRMITREAWDYHAEREAQRATEDMVLAKDAVLDPTDRSLGARCVREVADQIRDHREFGNYTTQHR